jgi:NAD(P)-dependent dehydrogenase (short-subunit alcohol dehydrogenase family)
MREQRRGRIITFSSTSGLYGNPGQANYGAAKSAIGGLTKVVAKDMGKYGVTANSICPVAATRMTMTPAVRQARERKRQAGVDRQRRLHDLESLHPDDVAPMVIFLASDHAAHVNGQFFLCAGGSISLLSLPRAVKTLWKDGRWSLDELDEYVPLTLTEGLQNPAPARAEATEAAGRAGAPAQ